MSSVLVFTYWSHEGRRMGFEITSLCIYISISNFESDVSFDVTLSSLVRKPRRCGGVMHRCGIGGSH